ncbi:hypothetical protein [Agathobaculum desmolans]|uniref:hypothetical protein n=1 Tax=Agathobaculum desmolans TaxID=39484 RepID=UPI00248ECBDC|nr:hypothetical protein [Agathobaculum desmolans]
MGKKIDVLGELHGLLLLGAISLLFGMADLAIVPEFANMFLLLAGIELAMAFCVHIFSVRKMEKEKKS